MKAVFLAALLFSATAASLPAETTPAAAPKECELCSGVVWTPGVTTGESNVPLLLEVAFDNRESVTSAIAAIPAAQRSRSTLLVSLGFGSDATVAMVEERLASLTEWARPLGPFGTFALDITGLTPELQSYAVKRIAVAAQGRELAAESALRFPSDAAALEAFYATGAQAYVDAWLIEPSAVATASNWLENHDPGKKLITVTPVQHTNALYDVAAALAAGARTVFLRGDATALAPSLATFNREYAGDFAFDRNSDTLLLDTRGATLGGDKPLAFVRGEDLRTLIVTPGETAAPVIVSVSADDGMNPRRVDATRAAKITDAGKKGRRLLVGLQPSTQPFLLTVDRPALPADVTKEAIDVATKRGLSVEEIVRRHQSYRDFQESLATKYIAHNATKLRFAVGTGDQIEATIAGKHFFDPNGHNDWVWRDLYINGVKWKYGNIPELPLIQPEKVSQLPLDIHLTNDYRYELVGETKLNGYDVYEVRFEPPANASKELPLYRGTVFIDTRSFARIRISMIQLHLSGEVLSNEERVDFVPFDAATHEPLDASAAQKREPRSLLWLPLHVEAEQVLSTAGRTTAVVRSTEFSDFRISPDDYETRLEEAERSNARMVRDTAKGLRYLEPRPDGTRVVKEGFDSSKLFALGGFHHDAGLPYPVVPLGGIDYFNFNVLNRGMQSNVFFAGVILAANLHKPGAFGTRFNVGGDMFGMAIPVENSVFRNGVESKGEAVKTLPLLVAGRVGHPVLGFGKVDLSVGVSHLTYQRSEDTASGFVVPSDTFEVTPGVDFRYERRGYTFATGFERGSRTTWEPWGNLSEYNEAQKNFTRWNVQLGKSFYLPKFQRLGFELDYLDGKNLDRFSKYELGFFGSNRVRGVRSGSVRAEQAILGHLSYGFVISDQIRLEGYYDHALIDDATAGYRREPFQGVGIAGQIIGPFGTLMRLDLGKTIGRNAQDNFVADVVFLKIFR